MSDIEIEIDGQKLSAKPNAMVIQVADEAGIYIPRFCYHKELSIAANCRMCLVEVEKSPKVLPACATPVMAGMKVFTKSPKALAAQKAVMEFLLINHPLDCPICDQGGECELQDLSMGYGSPSSFYHEGKRSVADKDIGPLIETDMTRCIQCTRCVRFGAEIAGMRELGATGRGEHMEIGTYINHAMQSEVSGNVIDICPVGALTSKPYRFTARPWELNQRPTVSPHDCIGSNLNAHMRNGTVMRMVPRENMAINEMWISDRDRFSYAGLYHADRVTQPLIKRNGEWQTADWATALEYAVNGIQRVLTQPEKLGALVSPNATLEEFYLLQKLVRGLGSSNIDHRLRQTDFSDQQSAPVFPGLGMPIVELEQADVVLLIGSNIQKEQPSAALRLRKAALKGAQLMVINPIDYQFHFDVVEKQIIAPDEMVKTLANLLMTLQGAANPIMNGMATRLKAGKKVSIILGSIAINHPQAALFRILGHRIAHLLDATVSILTEGANAAGAWLAGAIPHRGPAAAVSAKSGLNAQTMLTECCQAYLLLNVEPDLDCANPLAAVSALEQAGFVVSLSVFRNAVIDQHADVILPIGPFTETSGTFVNAAGDWQTFTGVASAFEEARPAWKVLRVLGNLLHLAGFDYESSEEVHLEIKTAVEQMPPLPVVPVVPVPIEVVEPHSLVRIGDIPLYSGDSLVRRSQPLQAAQTILEGETAVIRMHPGLAQRLQIQEGMTVTAKQHQGQVTLPVVFDSRLSERGVQIVGGVEASRGLSELFGKIEICELVR
jgi:NADH-quinone oxidoreductase subunit G